MVRRALVFDIKAGKVTSRGAHVGRKRKEGRREVKGERRREGKISPE